MNFEVNLEEELNRIKKQLLLNPVENFPSLLISEDTRFLHGLYVSDKEKTDTLQKNSLIAFSGRESQNNNIKQIYKIWSEKLHADNISMRLLSGLHAHIIIFMGIGKIGDTVMLLPEEAGGHFSTKKILLRLGYNVLEMPIDLNHYSIDHQQTYKVISRNKPNYIFMDRSEGINYEDFEDILKDTDACAIFDASQYLTNIIMGDFRSPFDMGFQIMMSTLHKNFPGPQKAMVCSKNGDEYWERISKAMSEYVSSLHVETTYMAGLMLNHEDELRCYAKTMLENSVALENNLIDLGIPMVKKKQDLPPTHHLWLPLNNRDKAFNLFKKLEYCNIIVNYRKLPYELGYGIRMGTAAATLKGLKPKHTEKLAYYIWKVINTSSISDSFRSEIQTFIDSISE